MLNRAYEQLPEQLEEQDRFQVPRARVSRQGRRSVIMNFTEIAEGLQRDPEHLLKFLLKETATRGNYDGTRVVFWIDKELGVLQRGRQEFIPIDIIDNFSLSDNGCTLVCNLGNVAMPLYHGEKSERESLKIAVKDLKEYCDKVQ